MDETTPQIETIDDHWRVLLDSVGYKYGYGEGLEEPVARALGEVLFKYVVANTWATGWGDYSDQELEAIGTFMKNLAASAK